MYVHIYVGKIIQTYFSGGRATILQKAKVNVIEIEKCRSWYKSQGKKTKIQESQICAGHEQGGVDACWVSNVLNGSNLPLKDRKITTKY